MLLISIFNIEIFILRWFGMSALLKTKNGKQFYFNRYLFVLQIIILALLYILKKCIENSETQVTNETIPNQTLAASIESSQTSSKAVKDSNEMIMTTISYMFNYYDTYIWLVVIAKRLRSEKGIEEIYNTSLVVDEEIPKLNSKSAYLQRFQRKFFWRLAIYFALQINLVYDISDPKSSDATLLQTIWIVTFCIVKTMMLNQCFTVLGTLAAQTEALTKAVETINHEQQLHKAHRLLVALNDTIKQANRIFDLQINITLVGNIIADLLVIFALICSVQENGMGALDDSIFLQNLKAFFSISGEIFYLIVLICSVKDRIQEAILSFQTTADRLKVSENFYSLVGNLNDNHFTFTLQNYMRIDDMTTITQVIIIIFFLSMNNVLYDKLRILVYIFLI